MDISLNDFSRSEIAQSELGAAQWLLGTYQNLTDEERGFAFVKERISDLKAQIAALETELAGYNAQ